MRERCFYKSGDTNIVDVAVMVGGVWVGRITGDNLLKVQQRYPGAQLYNLQTAFDEIDAALAEKCTQKAALITADRFDEMLNVLPPENWCRGSGGQSFKMCERMSGPYTSWFANLDGPNGTYFEGMARFDKPHSEIMAECRALLAANRLSMNHGQAQTESSLLT